MAFDNSCDFLVINRGKRRVLLKARSDAFKHRQRPNSSSKMVVILAPITPSEYISYPALFTGVDPCIKRGTIQL